MQPPPQAMPVPPQAMQPPPQAMAVPQLDPESVAMILGDFVGSRWARSTCEACGVGPTDYGAISGMFESVKVDGSKLTVKLKRNFNQKSQQLLDKLTRHLRKSGLPVKTLQYEEGGSPGMGGPPSLVRTIIIRGDIP